MFIIYHNMKKLSFLLLIFTALYLVSCGNKSVKNTSFLKYEYSESIPIECYGNNINYSYKFFLPGKSIDSNVAEIIKDTVLKYLEIEHLDFDNENFNEKMHLYLNNYVDSVYEGDFYLEEDFDYEYDIYDTLYFVGDNIICSAYYCYSFLGGAHGNFYHIKLYFDATNGSIYDFDNIFEDKQSVVDLIKDSLLAMDKAGKISFMYYDNMLISPQLELKPDTMVFVFNPYDVACYADGIVELSFDFNRIKEYMKPSTPIYKYLSGK